MAYVGQEPNGSFTTNVSKDSFDGDGSTTAFTLTEGASTNTVDVFVENVRQEPTEAYSVDGTTLTFTAAPPTGTGNIYVVNKSPVRLQAAHPSGLALEAHSATISTDLTVDGGVVDINGNELILDADGDTSITSDTDDQIEFKTGGSERLRITSGGEVQIGTTTSATNKLFLYDSNASDSVLYVRQDGAGPIQTWHSSAGTERMRISSSGVTTFQGNNTAPEGNSYGVFINATRSNGNTNGAVFGGIMVGYSGGNYGGIGYGLQPSDTSGRYISIINDYHSFLDFTAGGLRTYTTTVVRSNNSQLDFADELIAGPYVNRGAGSWTSSSDERLKQNISEISQTTAYDHVKTARAVQYNWKYGSNTSQDYIGFIAQDWETNYPEIVTTEDEGVHGVDDPKGIRYTETVPVLMAALKEAITKIEALETENATQATTIADFETRIAALEAN